MTPKTIPDIINEINQENGSIYKMGVLRKYQDNELLKKVLKMAYDKVTFTFGITMKNISYKPELNYAGPWPEKIVTLKQALDYIEQNFVTRKFTGNEAKYELTFTLESLQKDDAKVLEGIINRDLRINMGRTQINKVFKNLIVKPPYMRCGIYSDKTSKKISYPAFCQIKLDGTYRAVTVDNGEVTINTRSGETSNFPLLEKVFQTYPDGVYIGEMLIDGITNRAESNGLINSDHPPHDKVYIVLWDFITLDEYSRPKDKKNKTLYKKRYEALRAIVSEDDGKVHLVESVVVRSAKHALGYVSTWMKEGFEGGILKDPNNIFIDHTSPTQLKLKLEIDADVRITGFIEGTPGTKRAKTFGAITFETDDHKVKGSTSGFTDIQLEDFNSRREDLIGKVMAVQFNDITKGRDNDYYALSHPRFIEVRNDKTSTDTLERIQEYKEMATTLSVS